MFMLGGYLRYYNAVMRMEATTITYNNKMY